jgi:hypothetical protein
MADDGDRGICLDVRGGGHSRWSGGGGLWSWVAVVRVVDGVVGGYDTTPGSAGSCAFKAAT